MIGRALSPKCKGDVECTQWLLLSELRMQILEVKEKKGKA